MNTGNSLDVWEERWNTLKVHIDAVIARTNPQPGCAGLPFGWLRNLGQPPTPSRAGTLNYLANALKTFAEGQFTFLHGGLIKHTPYHLIESPEYPTPYVLSATLSQVASDLEVIERIVAQRSGDAQIRQRLELADRLAWDALKLAMGNLLPGQTTVITYFQKSPVIRMIPYAPVALIGIPFTCLSVPRDLLAIPHEVGHYVFWNGRLPPGKPLSKELLGAKLATPGGWYRCWVEEIFADVYGCLIGGAVIALDFQDLLLEASKKQFTQDDGKHPVPAIRPYIYTHTLRSSLGALAAKLNDRWDGLRGLMTSRVSGGLAKESYVPHDCVESPPPPGTVNLAQVRDGLPAVVDSLLARLAPVRSKIASNWSGNVAQSGDPEKPIDVIIYDQFKDFIQTTALAEDPPNVGFDIMGVRPDLWLDWVSQERFFTDQLPPSPPTKIEPGTPDKPGDGWVQVMVANGWTTRGPNSNWHM